MYTHITKTFQVHIPAEVRRKVGLKKTGKVQVRADGGRIIIEPVSGSFLEFGDAFGKTKKQKIIPVENIRSHIAYGDHKA